MYKSKEIRWFKNDADKPILDWFAGQGQAFENTESRTDFYLPLQKEDVAIKLREGNIEIKHRIGAPSKGKLSPTATGMFENWIKWSFNADKNDLLSQQIMSHNSDAWIETIKTRIGVKITFDSNNFLQILPIKTFVDFGCQAEYTQLKIMDRSFYTFALEWFGNRELPIPSSLLNDILGSAQFNIEDSMGYAEKLRSLSSPWH